MLATKNCPLREFDQVFEKAGEKKAQIDNSIKQDSIFVRLFIQNLKENMNEQVSPGYSIFMRRHPELHRIFYNLWSDITYFSISIIPLFPLPVLITKTHRILYFSYCLLVI